MTGTGWLFVLIAIIAAGIILWLMMGRKGADTPAAPMQPRAVEPPPPSPPVVPEAIPAAPPAPAAPVAKPAVKDAAPEMPGGDSAPDNLLALKGVGPKIATLLKAEGVTRFAQIATWTDADIAAIDARLGNFAGRAVRDNWVDQARLLAAKDVAAYEAKYGKL